MKHCILQDSSFLVATMSQSDDFHRDAVYVFQKIIENKKNVKVVVPSLVFYETIVTLHKKGMAKKAIEDKLWKFLYSDLVINVSQLETNAFKMCKKLTNENLSALRTHDFIINSIAIEYEAQILTFDRQVREKIGSFYDKIYYCSSIGQNSTDETLIFLNDLLDIIGKKSSKSADEISF